MIDKLSSSNDVIDLQLIVLFVTIARSATIAAAARQVNISPSLATRRLALLEAALHTRLFERTTRALHLTEAGRRTLEWAEAVLSSYNVLRDDLSLRDHAPEGPIRLAVSDYVASMLLPAFLVKFMKKYPRITFDIRTTDQLVNPVAQGFDVALHSGFMPDSSLIGVRVRPVQRVLCASPGYLAQAPELAQTADLASHVCLTHGASESQEWFFEHGGCVNGQKLSHRLSVDSFLALLQFALSGLGIARISRNVVRRQLDEGSLVQLLPDYRCVQPNGDTPAMWLIYPSRKLPYRVRTFVTEMQEYLDSI
jgi:LysR family transcriptional regulator, transcriptional activator for dmlA